MPALLALVEKESVNKVMIFFNTSMFAEEYHYPVKAGCKGIHMLHSKMSSSAAKVGECFPRCSECFFEFELDGQRYGLFRTSPSDSGRTVAT
jgi:hypothetical protein